MNDDAELLRRYAASRSEEAFAAVVQRHIDLVYHAAVRRCGGDTHRAEDVTQQVFTAVAREAAALADHPLLAGWLYVATRNLANKTMRAEKSRRLREETAHFMNEVQKSDSAAADWARLRPVLDDAIDELGEREREAVLLRYFENRPFAEIGASLRVTEDAARMRVDRALEKMHAALARRGVTSTAAALAGALASQAGAVAPAGLAASVAGGALAGASGGMLAATAVFMSATKLQMGIAAALVVAGTTGFLVQADTRASLRGELEVRRQQAQQVAALRAGNEVLRRNAAEVAELRTDDAEFAKLRDEAEAMKKQLQAAAAKKAAATVPDRRLPQPKVQVGAAYPAELRQAGISGEVQIDFLIDTEGVVRNAFVAKSTDRGFEAPSLEAAKQWQYEPGFMVNGRRVVTHMVIPIVFTPNRERGEPGTGKPENALPVGWF